MNATQLSFSKSNIRFADLHHFGLTRAKLCVFYILWSVFTGCVCRAEVYLEQLPGGQWAKLSDHSAMLEVPASLQGWYLQIPPLQQAGWRQLLTQQLLNADCQATPREFSLHFNWSDSQTMVQHSYQLHLSQWAGYWQRGASAVASDIFMTLSMQRAFSASVHSPLSAAAFSQVFWLPTNEIATPLSPPLKLNVVPMTPTILFWEDESQQWHALEIDPSNGPRSKWRFPSAVVSQIYPGSRVPAVQIPGQSVKSILVAANNSSGLQLLDAADGHSIPLPQQQVLMGSNLLVAMQPVAVDTDQDGSDDLIYVATQDGLVLRYRWQQGSGYDQQQVADLRQNRWRFKGNLQAMRARWPDSNGGGWMSGEVLVILAENELQQPMLLVLPVTEQMTTPWLPNQLIYRPIEQLQEVDLKQGMAWYTELPAAAVAAPQIMAGVLYLALQSDPLLTPACLSEPSTQRLLALHIFQGTAVYSQKVIPLIEPVTARFNVLHSSNPIQVLQLVSGQQLILPELVGISAACATCTEILHKAKFPKWQRIATYQQETGAY